MSRNTPRVFVQWRPRRQRHGDKRQADYSNPLPYVCGYWHVNGQQAGCSYSVEKHGIEECVRRTAQAIKKATGRRIGVRSTLTTLTW